PRAKRSASTVSALRAAWAPAHGPTAGPTPGPDHDDRRRGRAPQPRERGSAYARDPDHVDVEDAQPLLVGVGLDRALRADARIVDHDVEAPERLRRLLNRRLYRSGVRYVGRKGQGPLGARLGGTVEHGDRASGVQQLPGDDRADARAAARDDRGEAGEGSAHAWPIS